MKYRFFKKFLCLVFVVVLSTNTFANATIASLTESSYGYSAVVNMSNLNTEQAKATVLQQTYKLCIYLISNYQVNKQLSIVFKLNGKGFMVALVLPTLMNELRNGLSEETFYVKLVESKLIDWYDEVKRIK